MYDSCRHVLIGPDIAVSGTDSCRNEVSFLDDYTHEVTDLDTYRMSPHTQNQKMCGTDYCTSAETDQDSSPARNPADTEGTASDA